MALGTPVAGTVSYSGANGTQVSPAYPAGILSTDVVLFFLGQKPSTANGGTAATPAGWTLREEILAAGGYGTTLGVDTGNTNLRIYSWDTPITGQTGTKAIGLGQNNVSWAFIVRIPTGGGALSYGSADGQRTTTPTSPMSIALTNGATATDFQAGDKAIWVMCIPTDVTTPNQFSAQAVTATGAVFATATELREPDTAVGNDLGGYSAYAHVNSGSSTAAPTVNVTVAGTRTNVRGPVVLLRVRELAVSATATVTGEEATSAAEPITSAGDANTAATGTQATSAADTITATGTTSISGAASVTGASATSAAQSVAAVVAYVEISWLEVAPVVNVNGTATVAGAQATSAAQSVSGSGAANTTVTGTQATSAAATVTASGTTSVSATATVTGAQATSAAQSVTGSGAATATLAGAQATSAAQAISAGVSAAATVAGASASSAAQAISASGQANTTLTGASATASAGTATAFGSSNVPGTANVVGAGGTATAGTITAAGTALVSTGGTSATAAPGAVTASAANPTPATATVTGAQATATAATIQANSGSVIAPAGGTSRRRPFIIPPAMPRFDDEVSAVARVGSATATAEFGEVLAHWMADAVISLASVQSKSMAGRPSAFGGHNPSDEELLFLLAF